MPPSKHVSPAAPSSMSLGVAQTRAAEGVKTGTQREITGIGLTGHSDGETIPPRMSSMFTIHNSTGRQGYCLQISKVFMVYSWIKETGLANLW